MRDFNYWRGREGRERGWTKEGEEERGRKGERDMKERVRRGEREREGEKESTYM